MVWVGRVLEDHLLPTPLVWTGLPSVDQVAQIPIQPGLEHFPGWDVFSRFLLFGCVLAGYESLLS